MTKLPIITCKYCGNILVRGRKGVTRSLTYDGVRQYCYTIGCPVIFATISKNREIKWAMEATVNGN